MYVPCAALCRAFSSPVNEGRIALGLLAIHHFANHYIQQKTGEKTKKKQSVMDGTLSDKIEIRQRSRDIVPANQRLPPVLMSREGRWGQEACGWGA